MINNNLIIKVVFQQKGEKWLPFLQCGWPVVPLGEAWRHTNFPLPPVDLTRQMPKPGGVCGMKQALPCGCPREAQCQSQYKNPGSTTKSTGLWGLNFAWIPPFCSGNWGLVHSASKPSLAFPTVPASCLGHLYLTCGPDGLDQLTAKTQVAHFVSFFKCLKNLRFSSEAHLYSSEISSHCFWGRCDRSFHSWFYVFIL